MLIELIQDRILEVAGTPRGLFHATLFHAALLEAPLRVEFENRATVLCRKRRAERQHPGHGWTAPRSKIPS